jgi:tRNA-splicing ligase RtcB (3'-phosphate/5'-hydroxy nucleic acid ligase)
MSMLRAKDLSKIGYTNDQARSLVINIASRHFKHHSKDELIALLTDIKAHPNNYRLNCCEKYRERPPGN